MSSLLSLQGVLSEDGKAGKTGAPGENTCTQCHAGTALNAGGGYVFVESSNMIFGQHVLGQTYDMSVTVGQTGNSLFGFSVVALDANGNSVGTFTAGSDNHTENFTVQGSPRQYVTHNLNSGASQDEHTFNFTWTAPSEDFGTVTFYATGLAANGNGMNSGDKVYSSTMESPVMPSTSVLSNNLREIEMFWNPSIKSLLVNGQMNMDKVKLTVFDAQGKVELNLKGLNQNVVDLSQLSSGFHLVNLEYSGKRLEKKIIL